MTFNQSHIFDTLASQWWDEEGPFKPLHAMNPLRLEFILNHLQDHFKQFDIKGLRILDIGCGGGLLCEPLARLGAHVMGIDLSKEAIETAREHANKSGLSIDYKEGDLASMEESVFDVVIASEVIEHVNDPKVFVQQMARSLKKSGCAVITTLNRTPKSYLLGIIAAEYILKWAPRGTHEHHMFIRPSELNHFLEQAGMMLKELQGVVFNPLRWQWEFSKDMDVNYFSFIAFQRESFDV